MPPDGDTDAQLATFDPPVARAVAMVLRREGVPATVESLDHGEAEVRVSPDRRDEALALLARHMEQVHELAADEHAGAATATPLPLDTQFEDDDAGPPIVMERLRRMGLGLALVLAPLLIITLSGADLPMGYAVGLFVVGLAAVVYWRNRQTD